MSAAAGGSTQMTAQCSSIPIRGLNAKRIGDYGRGVGGGGRDHPNDGTVFKCTYPRDGGQERQDDQGGSREASLSQRRRPLRPPAPPTKIQDVEYARRIRKSRWQSPYDGGWQSPTRSAPDPERESPVMEVSHHNDSPSQSDFVDLGLKIPRPRVPLLHQNAQVPSDIRRPNPAVILKIVDITFFFIDEQQGGHDGGTIGGGLVIAIRCCLGDCQQRCIDDCLRMGSACVAHTAAPPLCRRAELRDANWTPAVQISYSLRRFTPQMPTAFHQTLLDDPVVITQRKNPTAPRTILDGKLGAILTESPFIITTPNASWIPNPSRTPNEILQIRRDFLYGAEDPLLWPQEDEPSAPYLPCLLRIFPRDGSVDDNLAFLWDSPSQSQHFVEDASFRRGCGHATPGLSRDLEACLSCLEAMFSCVSYPPETMQAFHRHTSIMSVLTQMLRLTPLPLPHFWGMFRSFQRLGRQCVALHTFMELVFPVGSGTLSHNTVAPFREDFVGCFTFDVAVGKRLLQCGIPVWLLRDIEMFEQCRVDSLAPITYAKDILEVSLPTPIVPPLWEGPRRGMGKIKALTSYIERNQGSFVSPLTYALSGAARPQIGLPAASSSSRSTVRPPGRGPQTKVLVYPEHELLPRIFTTWQSVVAKIDESYDLALCVEKPLERYFLPRPDLFTNVNSRPKLFEYLVSWLRIRGIVLSCMGHGQPQAISHKAWRLWLDRCDLEVTVTEGGTNAPRKMKDKEEVMALLAVAREHGSVELPDEGKWKGRIFRSDGLLAERHGREILWEVNELAFRCELAALDERLSTLSSAHERYNRVRRCFPIGLAPLHFADLGQANHGLAHPDWFSRAPFVYALRHVMRFWKLDVVHAARWLTDEQYFKIDEKRGLTEANLDDVEHKLIKIYISSFLAVYGRTPRLPMILSHHPHTEWKQPVYHRMAVGPNGIWMPERESDSLYDY
ncbi:hypothetical protein BDZ89DRAFT_1051119 [Hymenopellis radicata]|nr:hypothetical protein BDZ89DRAFT_1051119 [Hymenopellis radicata]